MDDEENMFEMFDEFGNYIGQHANGKPHIDEDAFEEFAENEEDILREEEERIEEDQIILYEDKKYYPEMEEVYRGAETLIEEEDAQAITDPLIKDYKEKKFDLKVPSPQLIYSNQFLMDMMKNPNTIKNVALVGHLHHGKTMLMDTLISQTHIDKMPEKFTDARFDESERKISIKACPMSLILPNTKGKNYLVNIIDTPGHPNFVDEACCGLRLADGAVLVVDSIEGCMGNTEHLINYIVHEQIPVGYCYTSALRHNQQGRSPGP
jgi:U5 small nuclear ribonucleoprotein component